MAIRPTDIENRERDQNFDILNRDPGTPQPPAVVPAPPSAVEPAPRGKGRAVDELAELRERIARARTLKPDGVTRPGRVERLHCTDCWQRGRDAALRVIDDGR